MIIIASLLCLTACRTPQQLAQRYLKKAIKLDSTVVQNYRLDTVIKGVAKGNIIVKTPESEGEFDFNCDSIAKLLAEYKSKELKPGEVLLFSDSNINVSAKKDTAGNFKIKYKFKPKYINVPVRIPYEVKVSVPGKTIRIEVDKPAYKYIWFWVLSSFLLLAVILLLRKSKPVVYIQEKFKTKE